jgi:hypothetical protein
VFPSSVRIAVALVLFILGTFLASFGRVEGLFLIIGALYWLFTYVRYGPIKVAFVAYRRGQLDKAKELVAGVRWPRLLADRLRPYYHWVRGGIAAHDGDLETARDEYTTALALRPRVESDRSVLSALLAELAVMRGDRPAAREHLAAARGLDHREDLDPFLEDLERRAAE